MPIYQVRQKEGGSDVRLVDAKNGTTALKHVTGDMFEVELCDGKELFRLGQSGVELEIAEPEPPQPNDPPAPTPTPPSPKEDEFGPVEDLNAERAARED
jgi:hypothetical protein